MQGGARPSAEQQKWWDCLSQIGCVACGIKDAPVQLHHLKGSTFKHEKILVGNWWVIPVHWMLHDPSSDHCLNVTHRKEAFHDRFGAANVLLRKARDLVLERVENPTVIPEQMLWLADDYYFAGHDTSDWESWLESK